MQGFLDVEAEEAVLEETRSKRHILLADNPNINTLTAELGNCNDEFIDQRGGRINNDVMNTIYGENGVDTLTGAGGIDEFHGGDNNDVLRGRNNNDLLYGDSGEDNIRGGEFTEFDDVRQICN